MNFLSPCLAWTVGPMEGLLLLVVIILLFGAKRLPELARSLGRSLNEFKRGKEEINKEIEAGRKEVADAASEPADPADVRKST